MIIFSITIFIATVLCFITTGFLFAFSVVLMPGIKKLDDKSFLRSFQVIDGVIQDNDPVFLFVWIGSVTSLVLSLVLGWFYLDGFNFMLLSIATFLYIFVFQLMTIRINIPLNNKLQSYDLDSLDKEQLLQVRQDFEAPWNRANVIRTYVSLVSTLIILKVIIS